MTSSFSGAGLYLIQIVFDSYVAVLMLRLLLQQLGASFFNPIVQFTVKITDPIILPLRRILPKVAITDLSCILAIFIVLMIKITLLMIISVGIFPHLSGLLILTVAQGIDSLINIFFYAIIIVVIISWINPTLHSPVTEILFRLTDPLLGRARRLIPNIGGLDISPLPVIIGLKLLTFVLVQPLAQVGYYLSLQGLIGFPK